MLKFADDTVTCSAASFAPAVEQLLDETLNDWSQRRNVGKTERLLVVPNAPRVQVGVRNLVVRKLGLGLRLFVMLEGSCLRTVDMIMTRAIGSVGLGEW